MTRFVEYTTRPGDRWDLIAYSAYGDADRYGPIVDANRALFATDPLTPLPRVLPVGLTLRVPLLDAPVTLVAPPWRTG
ncbi:MAG: hypothetical protein QM651_17845 [Rhodoblastus sp.]